MELRLDFGLRDFCASATSASGKRWKARIGAVGFFCAM